MERARYICHDFLLDGLKNCALKCALAERPCSPQPFDGTGNGPARLPRRSLLPSRPPNPLFIFLMLPTLLLEDGHPLEDLHLATAQLDDLVQEMRRRALHFSRNNLHCGNQTLHQLEVLFPGLLRLLVLLSLVRVLDMFLAWSWAHPFVQSVQRRALPSDVVFAASNDASVICGMVRPSSATMLE